MCRAVLVMLTDEAPHEARFAVDTEWNNVGAVTTQCVEPKEIVFERLIDIGHMW